MKQETKRGRGRPKGFKPEHFAYVPLEKLIEAFNPKFPIPIKKELAEAMGLTNNKPVNIVEDEDDIDEENCEELEEMSVCIIPPDEL